jgi:hypothetical protein
MKKVAVIANSVTVPPMAHSGRVPVTYVACCNAEGQVTVNGVPLRESSYLTLGPPSLIRFSVTVPAGRL